MKNGLILILTLGLSLISTLHADSALPPMLLGTYAGAVRKTDGHIDIHTMADTIAEGGMNFYNYLIWENENDWPDLPSFLEAMRARGIVVIVTIVPKNEPPCSKPFCYDFDRWGKELAQLSLSFENLVGYSIDDWYVVSAEGSGRNAARSVNPRFKFYPTIYLGCPYRLTEPKPDGVILYPEETPRENLAPDLARWYAAISSCIRLYPKDTIVGVFASLNLATISVLLWKLKIAHSQHPSGLMTYALPFDGPIWIAVTDLYKLWWAAIATATSTRSERHCRPLKCGGPEDQLYEITRIAYASPRRDEFIWRQRIGLTCRAWHFAEHFHEKIPGGVSAQNRVEPAC